MFFDARSCKIAAFPKKKCYSKLGSAPLNKAIVAKQSTSAAYGLGLLVCWSVSDHLAGQSFLETASHPPQRWRRKEA